MIRAGSRTGGGKLAAHIVRKIRMTSANVCLHTSIGIPCSIAPASRAFAQTSGNMLRLEAFSAGELHQRDLDEPQESMKPTGVQAEPMRLTAPVRGATRWTTKPSTEPKCDLTRFESWPKRHNHSQPDHLIIVGSGS